MQIPASGIIVFNPSTPVAATPIHMVPRYDFADMATLPVHQSAFISMLSFLLVNALHLPFSQSITALKAITSSLDPVRVNPSDVFVPKPAEKTEA